MRRPRTAWGPGGVNRLMRSKKTNEQPPVDSSLPRPSTDARRRSWRAFQRALDPLGKPKPLPPAPKP